MTSAAGAQDIQLLEHGASSSDHQNAEFTLTTTSWQRHEISFVHEAIVYAVLMLGIGGFATLILFAFIDHHVVYEILGALGCLLLMSLCFGYYIRHCFGVCFKNQNRIVFNENAKAVEIFRNNVFAESVAFEEYDGLAYNDRHVYVCIKPQFSRMNIALNPYRCDAKRGKDFVLMVQDIWAMIKQKHQTAEFEPVTF